MPHTGSLHEVRQALDQHARARRQAFIDAGELEVCASCQGDLDTYTTGCDRCWDRKRRRERRANPEFLALERERQRASRARRRKAPA